MLIKIFKQKQALLLTYKLLYDLIFILLIIFSVIILAEGVLPNFSSSHLNITAFIFVLLSLFLLTNQLSTKFKFAYPAVSIRKNKFIPLFVIIIILLLGSSMLKFSLWKNLAIVFGTLFVLFFFYRIIFRAEP